MSEHGKNTTFILMCLLIRKVLLEVLLFARLNLEGHPSHNTNKLLVSDTVAY